MCLRGSSGIFYVHLLMALLVSSCHQEMSVSDFAGGSGNPDIKMGSSQTLVSSSIGITCKRARDGSALCWGAYKHEDFGDPQQDKPHFFKLSDLSSVSLSVGGVGICIVTYGGVVKCLEGVNIYEYDPRGDSKNLNFVQVLDIFNAVAVSNGWFHACAVLGNGTVRCWVPNYSGVVMGDGAPRSAEIPGISTAVAVSVGSKYTCSLLRDSTVKCWGMNDHGQLGNGSTSIAYAPVQVLDVSSVVSLSVGDSHACIVDKQGAVKCWGVNAAGQLGDGTAIDKTKAVDVIGISTAVAVSAGAAHTCALLRDGRVKCWGANDSGQLGDGSSKSASVPVEVLGISDAVEISVGTGYTCALLSGHSVKCWGYNEDGALGDGTNISSNIPVDCFF